MQPRQREHTPETGQSQPRNRTPLWVKFGIPERQVVQATQPKAEEALAPKGS